VETPYIGGCANLGSTGRELRIFWYGLQFLINSHIVHDRYSIAIGNANNLALPGVQWRSKKQQERNDQKCNPLGFQHISPATTPSRNALQKLNSHAMKIWSLGLPWTGDFQDPNAILIDPGTNRWRRRPSPVQLNN
jgi:hypothetical protein